MNEQASTVLSRKPCGWCCRGGAASRPGFFRDLDIDMGYGVGVCGGCGGLGYTVDDPGFRPSAERITELRFAYCPVSKEQLWPGGAFPPSVCRERLLNLKAAVTDHYSKYGPQTDEERESDKSFAQKIVQGALDSILTEYEAVMTQDAITLRVLGSRFSERYPDAEALALAAEGKFPEAEALFQRFISEWSEESIPQHNLGVFYVVYRRDPKRALPYFLKSTQLLPAKTLHFMQAIRVLLHLDRLPEAVGIARRAKQCPDFDRASDEEKRLIDELIKAS